MASDVRGGPPLNIRLRRILIREADRLSKEISLIEERMSGLGGGDDSVVERIILSIRREELSRELEEIAEVLSLDNII